MRRITKVAAITATAVTAILATAGSASASVNVELTASASSARRRSDRARPRQRRRYAGSVRGSPTARIKFTASVERVIADYEMSCGPARTETMHRVITQPAQMVVEAKPNTNKAGKVTSGWDLTGKTHRRGHQRRERHDDRDFLPGGFVPLVDRQRHAVRQRDHRRPPGQRIAAEHPGRGCPGRRYSVAKPPCPTRVGGPSRFARSGRAYLPLMRSLTVADVHAAASSSQPSVEDGRCRTNRVAAVALTHTVTAVGDEPIAVACLR